MRRVLCLCLLALFVIGARAAGPLPVPVDLQGDPLPAGVVARLGSTRFRESNACQTVAYSPDGKTLASAGSAGVALWDAAAGRLKRLLPITGVNHAGLHPRYPLAFSPDGNHLAVGFARGPVHLWDLRRGGEPRLLRELGNENHFVAFGVGGRELLVGNGGRVLALDLSPGGKPRTLLETSDRDEGGYPRCHAFAISPDRKTLAVSHFPRIAQEKGAVSAPLIDIASGKPLDSATRPAAWKIAFSPDGKRVYFECEKEIVALDSASGKRLLKWKRDEKRHYRPHGHIEDFAISPNGKWLAGRGALFDAETGEVLAELGHDWTWPQSACFSPDGKRLACGTTEGHALVIWDLSGKRPTRLEAQAGESLGHRGEVTVVAYSRDGRRIATAAMDGTVRLWDAATGKQMWVASTPSHSFRSLAFSPDDGTLAVGGSNIGVMLFDTQTGTLKRQPFVIPGEIVGRGTICSLSFTRDGRFLRAAGRGNIACWNIESGKLDSRHVYGEYVPEVCAFSPVDDCCTVKVSGKPTILDSAWRLRTKLTMPHERNVGMSATCFSPDGTLISVVSSDEVWTFRVSTLSVPGPSQKLDSGPGYCSVAISPDNRMVLGSSLEGFTYVWEIATGAERRRFPSPGEGRFAAFSPDGRTIAVVGRSASVLVRRVRHDALAFAPDAAAMERASEALRGDSAEAAYRAVCDLAARPGQSVPLLAARLRPAPADNPVARLIRDLGDDEFAVRERASVQLRKLGFAIRAELLKARETTDDLEVRQRIDRLLRRPVRAPDAETLRAIRAIETLEMAGGPEAIKVLARLAEGGAWAMQTQHAQEALTRLRTKGRN